jgi:hypothetical protein
MTAGAPVVTAGDAAVVGAGVGWGDAPVVSPAFTRGHWPSLLGQLAVSRMIQTSSVATCSESWLRCHCLERNQSLINHDQSLLFSLADA